MTPFAARCLLVGAAIVLAAGGTVAPGAAVPRVVLLVAAGTCALLDVLLVRGVRAAATARDRRVDAVVPVPTVRASTAPSDADDDHGIVLGSTADGRTVGLGEAMGAHVVVVGTGVLAVAVFRALVTQVRHAAAVAGAVTRLACDPELRLLLALDDERCPPTPAGTAVLVSAPGTARCSSAVLVPGDGQVPRRWDVVVEVTRYGCSVRRSGEAVGVPVSPVLPALPALQAPELARVPVT